MRVAYLFIRAGRCRLYRRRQRWHRNVVKSPLWILFIAWLGSVAAEAAEVVPDFRLADVNTNSTRKAGIVSPRDYLFQVSGYYFAEAH